jgi:predicted permease
MFFAQLTANGILILPIFAPILVGIVLKRIALMPDEFWPQIERLTYFVLLPALIANAIATSSLSNLSAGPILLALMLGVAATVGILYGVKCALRMPGVAFGPLFHGCIRPNGYMGLATGFAVLGAEGVGAISIVVAIWVPLGLALASVAFLREMDGGSIKLTELTKRLIKNPLVVSVVIGFALNGVGAGPFLSETPLLDIVGRAAVAAGLIAVGVGLDFKALRTSVWPLACAIALGLLVMPLLMASIGLSIGLEGAALGALVIFAAMPTSPSGFVMAGQMRADAALMAAIISSQTLVSIVTIACVITILL